MRHSTLAILAAMAFFASSAAYASTNFFCVGNDPELDVALSQATLLAHLNGSDSEIHIRQGAHTVTNPPNFDFQEPNYAGLKLLGGFSDSTCTSRQVNPANTTVTISDTESTHFIGTDITIEGLTFGSNYGIEVGPMAQKDEIYDSTVNILSNSFKTPLFVSSFDGQVAVRTTIANNLFAGSTPDGAHCAILLWGDTYGTQHALIANNTITKNSGAGICTAFHVNKVSIYNNIIWGNQGAGIYDYGSATTPSIISTYNNILQSNNQVAQPWVNLNPIVSDPFFVDAANNNFHLKVTAPKSPAIDSGVDLADIPGDVPDTDIEGNSRPIGAHVDRGAYESAFDDSLVDLVVNTNSDAANPGPGKLTLRAAINLVNQTQSSVTRSIRFAMPGACTTATGPLTAAGVINLSTPLPDITHSLSIQGYSQDKASINSSPFGTNAHWCVGIVGALNHPLSGLHVPANAAPDVKLVASGLRFAGFQKAVWLEGGANHRVSGNGFDPTGLSAPNDIDIELGDATTGVEIGGSYASQRNLLSYATDAAVVLRGNGNYVINNLIGTRPDGQYDAAARNATGVRLKDAVNSALTKNTITGNTDYGVQLINNSHDNYVQENAVGPNDNGLCGTPNCTSQGSVVQSNGIAGISATATTHDNYIFSNEVAFNNVGICVYGQSIWMSGNRVYDNALLGIDLAHGNEYNAATCAGIPTLNDIDPLESTANPANANGGMNFPVLLWAGGIDGSGNFDGKPHGGLLRGQLPSADGNYAIQVYASKSCNASGYGEGEEVVGSTTLQIGDAGGSVNGVKNFSVALNSSLPLTGRAITAIARDTLNSNTSEFSRCVPFVRETGNPVTGDRLFVDPFENPPGS